MKVRILLWIGLALAVVAAGGLWTLGSLLPRAKPETPLEKAAADGSPGELQRRLQTAGSVDTKDSQGFTALDWAARSGRADAIHALVQAGADPELRDSGPNGWTPMLHAVHKNQPAAVRALLAAGADPNARGDSGLTPLLLAAAQGEPEIVEELLEAGADPRLRGPSRWSVLEQAVAHGHPEVVDVLLRKDPELHLGNSPRVWAVRALAWVQGRSELLDRIDRGREVVGR